MSVCSGSALLAKAGLLDGRRATSNKQFFDLAARQSDRRWTGWPRRAGSRTGRSRRRRASRPAPTWRSRSIARLYGRGVAQQIADATEYEWQTDPTRDPFVKFLNHALQPAKRWESRSSAGASRARSRRWSTATAARRRRTAWTSAVRRLRDPAARGRGPRGPSWIGRLKTWAHGGKQAYVARPDGVPRVQPLHRGLPGGRAPAGPAARLSRERRCSEGSCLCGAIRYEVSGAIGPMVYCHCSMCRKASGSSFATNAPVDAAGFRFTAGEDRLGRYESSPGRVPLLLHALRLADREALREDERGADPHGNPRRRSRGSARSATSSSARRRRGRAIARRPAPGGRRADRRVDEGRDPRGARAPMSEAPRLDVYYDYGSPFAYLAAELLASARGAARRGARLEAARDRRARLVRPLLAAEGQVRRPRRAAQRGVPRHSRRAAEALSGAVRARAPHRPRGSGRRALREAPPAPLPRGVGASGATCPPTASSAS